MRKYLLVISFVLLVLMVPFLLMGRLDTADLLGSLGFGSLMVVTISYLPQLLRKGYIDKF